MELEVIRISSGTDSNNGVLFEIDKHASAPHAEGYRCKRKFLAYTLAATGYANNVNGVAAASIGKINGVATASIEKVNGT